MTVPICILLIEDSPNDTSLILRALERNGLGDGVVSIGDGDEALDFVFARGKYAGRNRGNLPRLVLLDLKLPRRSGLEVLRELRATPLAHDLPIVVFTSSREPADIRSAYALGANSFVQKPMEPEEFTETLVSVARYWLILNHPARAAELRGST